MKRRYRKNGVFCILKYCPVMRVFVYMDAAFFVLDSFSMRI